MTRALKALREQEKRGRARKEDLEGPASQSPTRSPGANANARCETNGVLEQAASSSRSTPTVLSSDTTDFEADVKSEDEDLSISSTPPMDFIPLTSRIKSKKEERSSTLRSFMSAFQTPEEVSFQSLTGQAGGKPLSFKANKNYKYSTILMMLKDLHDARERDGTPLELQIGPPSAHVKKEPLVMPGEVAAPGSLENAEQTNQQSHFSPNKFTPKEDGAWLVSKRPCVQKGNSSRIRKKANRRVPSQPSRPGPGFPGLESPAAAADPPGVASPGRSPLDTKSGTWGRLAGGQRGVPPDEAKRWSRGAEDLEDLGDLGDAVPSEQPNGLLADFDQADPRLMRSAGGGDQSSTGRVGTPDAVRSLETHLPFVLFPHNVRLPQ